MSNSQYSYRPHMNRAVTRKWAEARQVDYGGDDWGDDGYGEEPSQPALSQDRRSFTNPPALNTNPRLSFDRGQEQRTFSAGAADPRQDSSHSQTVPAPSPRYYAQQNRPSEPISRPSTDSYQRDAARPTSRGSNSAAAGFPFTNPSLTRQDMPDYTRQASYASSSQDYEPVGRPSIESYQRLDSYDPSSTARAFPPRKSSLGQQDILNSGRLQLDPTTVTNEPLEKPLPFIRPADIYKKHLEEEQRRSQESSRPSMDSIRRDTQDTTPKQSVDLDSPRKRQPALGTVAERKSEYLDSPLNSPVGSMLGHQQHLGDSPTQTDTGTNLQHNPSIQSASSRYTDKQDSASASTASSRFPSRSESQHETSAPQQTLFPSRSGLPLITRTSTFGSDFLGRIGFADRSPAANAQPDQPDQPDQPSPATSKNTDRGDLQHDPSQGLGYRNIVDNAFQAENQGSGPLSSTGDSLLRSNTTSTSQISPIVSRSEVPEWNPESTGNMRIPDEPSALPDEDDFQPPKRLGTNRRDSPSPARRPLSREAPATPEPQSAVTMTDETPDLATEAQITRPGPAVLVHSRGASRESIHSDNLTNASSAGPPRQQSSSLSELPERSNQRTASEEWADWSAARKAAHARHGLQDSNPTTPALELSGKSTPAPFDPLDKNVPMPTSAGTNDSLKPRGAATLSALRPQVARDESFRPSLPGGWQSTTSIQRFIPEPVTSHQTPTYAAPAARSDSIDSIPTATAPVATNWRSEYRSPQAEAFAAASAAGAALAGIFNGPALTSRGGDSEVSSINEHDDGPTGRNRDENLRSRDFADSPEPSEPPAVPEQYATRDFASSSLRTNNTDETTPKAQQAPSTTKGDLSKPPPLMTNYPELRRTGADSVTHSPAKESERWWSDDEDGELAAPAPLRTNRASTLEPARTALSPVMRSDSASPDADQLESEIVQSLTPKSSTVAEAQREHGRSSPLRQDSLRPLSPPFAAAALALSPASSYKPLHDQNAWKPLSAPSSKTPSPDKLHLPSFNPTQILPDFEHDDNLQTPDVDPADSDDDYLGNNTKPLAGLGAAKVMEDISEPKQDPTDTKELTGNDDTSTIPPAHGRLFQPEQHSPFIRTDSNATSSSLNDMPGAFETATPPADQSLLESAKHSPFIPEDSNSQNVFNGRSHTTGFAAADEGSTQRSPNQYTAAPSADSGANQSASSMFVHQHSGETPPNDMVNAPAERHRLDDDDDSNLDSAPELPAKDRPTPITAAPATTARSSTPSTPTAKHNTQPSTSTVASPQTIRQNQSMPPYDSSRSFPSDSIPVAHIMSMGSAQQRTKAYNDNREAYAQPVGHLENWLAFMNTNDHADAFTPKLSSNSPHTSASPRFSRHLSTGPPSGSKQLQEDGKKLLASASKYGAKAGVLGKGLFSKGKDKLRTVSANQKGSLMGRDKNTSVPEISRQQSYISNSSAPQLPTPSMSTPIDESSFSAYFMSREDNTTPVRPPIQPPFSPVSEASTNRLEPLDSLKRTVSAVSQDQTTHPVTSTPQQAVPPIRNDTVKSTAAVSALDNETENRGSTNMLGIRPGDVRRDSSISEVSSVSDRDDHRLSLAAGTISPPLISPPLEGQMFRNQTPLPTTTAVMNAANEEPRSRDVPPYSTVMGNGPARTTPRTSKEIEASQDREEESTLPAYNPLPDHARGPRITPGAQIVPIARIRPDQEVVAEQPRPFSFIGNESLSKTGYPANHSIDNPGVHTGNPTISPGADRNAAYNALNNSETSRNQNASPLPSAGRRPEEFGNRTPAEFARLRQQTQPIQTQPDSDAPFRIPGPYTKELRSPKPKTSSPMLDQTRTTPTSAQPQGDAFRGLTTAPENNASAAGIADQQQYASGPQGNASGVHPDSRTPYDSQRGGDALESVPSEQEDLPEPPGGFGHMDRDKDKDRGRVRLSSLFRTRSKSQSRWLRREQKDQQSEQRPDYSRKNSLFKLGSRSSTSGMPGMFPGTEGNYDEPTDQTTQETPRPGVGSRRQSKDLFKSTTFGQQGSGQGNYSQQGPMPPGKKKRFSALFTKPAGRNDQYQAPGRASTMPLDAQQSNGEEPLVQAPPGPRRLPSVHNQITMPQSPQQPMPNAFQQQNMYAGQQQHYGQYPSTGQQVPAQSSQSFQGTLPPAQGYYGQPEQSYFPQQQPLAGSPYQYGNLPYQSGNDRMKQAEDGQYFPPQSQTRPDLPHLNTGEQQPSASPYVSTSAPSTSNAYPQSTPQQHVYPSSTQPQSQSQPPYVPTTRANKDISHNSDVRLASPTAGSSVPPQRYGQTPGETSKITPRVAALHTRSRSPKLGRQSSEDLTAEFNSAAPQSRTPVEGLGTFTSKKVGPADGVPRTEEEQEKPWAITLPGEEDARKSESNDPASATSSKAREMRRLMLERSPMPGTPGTGTAGGPQQENRPLTVAEKYMGITSTAKPAISSPDMQSSAFGNTTSPTVQSPMSAFAPTVPIVPPVRSDSPSVVINKRSSQRHFDSAPMITSPLQSPRMDFAATSIAAPPRTGSPSVTISRKSSMRGQAPTRASIEADMNRNLSSMRAATPTSGRRVSRDADAVSRDASQAQRQAIQAHMDAPVSAPPPPPVPKGIGSLLAANAGASTSLPASNEAAATRNLPQSDSTAPSSTKGPSLSVPGAFVDQSESSRSSTSAPSPSPTNAPASAKTAGLSNLVPNQSKKAEGPATATGIPPAPPEVFEMPGSRPDGYESEEEVVMSATAYPGQEWMPVFDIDD